MLERFIVHRVRVRQPRRRRPHVKRHHAAVLRAFTDAKLYRRGEVRTQQAAAESVASTVRYVTAAAVVLQAEDPQLFDDVLSGRISLLAAAKQARKRAALLAAYREATPGDRIAAIRTISPAVVFDEAVAPALAG